MGKYFTITELCDSDTAKDEGIDNTPPPGVQVKLTALISRLLDPVREAWGSPIKVNSGFRCPVLNKRVRGRASSQHVKGEAADITAGSPERNRQLFELIRDRFEFDQLIDENNYTWLHVSYRCGGNRKEVLHEVTNE